MLQVQTLSAPFARHSLQTLLICAGLASSPFALAQTASTATSDGTNVTIKLGHSTTPTWARVYLDTDRNVSTGYRAYNVGSSYMIENGRLYRYSGANGAWGWTFVKTVSVSASATLTTLTLAKADIGSPAAANLVTQSEAPVRVSPIISLSMPAAPVAGTWKQCAIEWGTCSFSGTAQVRYGTASAYVTKTLTGPVACSNAVFGDPAPTYGKSCHVSATSTTSPTPTPTPN
ncbi:MAG: hypothetical protein EOP92_27880, partial [Lysobacteraceae bacterium]